MKRVTEKGVEIGGEPVERKEEVEILLSMENQRGSDEGERIAPEMMTVEVPLLRWKGLATKGRRAAY